MAALKQGCFFEYYGVLESFQTKPKKSQGSYTMIIMNINGGKKSIPDFDNKLINLGPEEGSYCRISGEINVGYDGSKQANTCIYKINGYEKLMSKQEFQAIQQLSVDSLLQMARNQGLTLNANGNQGGTSQRVGASPQTTATTFANIANGTTQAQAPPIAAAASGTQSGDQAANAQVERPRKKSKKKAARPTPEPSSDLTSAN